ncbi:unnamed protein product (macronuclear) [Paramecium tetraurelia]|uniref:Uncharacterized protein n=1 Tax=Paramecium tetraurelia TaxID=5888 RepID=A0BIP7_PARTE|nr:uncharacterized protein GSPATT00004786001 [Paramecium tetraurelia]CAK58414.1 unnamed protein product [Paramecium tetraurelia]|eukprot:XP_001425812.1 hypothetical protein (macronuclear) [Paramecium tetraurelia strain d4-2]
MRPNKNNEDGTYWKLQYEQLKKQKKIFYSNDTNQQLVSQLQEKCLKQEQQIEKLNQLIKQATPSKITDPSNEDFEIIKVQFKTQIDQKDSLILQLQRDNLNIQKIALEQLKKSDFQIEQQRCQITQLKQQIEELNQLVSHLQQKLLQEQQETKEFKEKIIICEKMNEALEQTIETLNQKSQTSREKQNKDVQQWMQKFKKLEQEYIILKTKIEDLSKSNFGKYSIENLDLVSVIDKINEKINQLQEECKGLKLEKQQLSSEHSQLQEKLKQIEINYQQQLQQIQELQTEINYQQLKAKSSSNNLEEQQQNIPQIIIQPSEDNNEENNNEEDNQFVQEELQQET